MTSAWELRNEVIQAHVNDLHDQMRMMYAIPPLNVLSPEKLKEVKKEVHSCEACRDRGFPVRDKTELELAKEKMLLAKPHPKDCICPKCKGKTGIVSTVKRIGDAERDACLALLDERLASGHITLEEFQVRADKALTARNQHELDYLTQDLPAAAGKSVAAPAAPKTPLMRSPWWFLASSLLLLGDAGFTGGIEHAWGLASVLVSLSVITVITFLVRLHKD